MFHIQILSLSLLPLPPVLSAAPSLTLLSSTEDSLHISATLAHLGLPAVTAVELNVTSPVVLTQRVDISDGDALPVTVTFTLRKLQFGTVYSVLAYGVGDGGPGAVTQRDFMTGERFVKSQRLHGLLLSAWLWCVGRSSTEVYACLVAFVVDYVASFILVCFCN